MAFIEISELAETLNIDNDSVFPLVYQGVTKKVTLATLINVLAYFNSASYNKTTGVLTIGQSNNASVTLNTGLQESIKNISITDGVVTITKQDNSTFTVDISVANQSITAEKLSQELQIKINSIDDKVDKETGKGLSTNDYTTVEKNKLAGIETGAEVNEIDTVKVDGVALVPENKIVNIDLTGVVTGNYYYLATAEDWESFNNDFDYLVGNKIYLCSQNATVSASISHMPFSTFQGTVLSYSTRASNTLGLVQIAVSPSRGAYYRICWSSTWSSWYSLAEDVTLMKGGININNADAWSNYSNDFNNIPANKIYLLTQNSTVGATLSNKPINGNPAGTLMCYNLSANASVGCVQIYINNTGTVFAYRINWAGTNWSNWLNLGELANINILQNKGLNELYKSFDTVGVIGDSLASGECAYKDNGNTRYIDIYEKSWGQFMARDSGNTYYNFSKGGLTTRSWFTESVGYATASDGNHACKAYIIGLGVNDRGIEDYLGQVSDIDLSDYTNNLDTFYGNYGKIIQTMKIIQPKAKFFLLTIPITGETTAAYNTAIRNIAELFDNVYVIDLMEDYYSLFDPNSFIRLNLRGGHYNALTYEYIAKIFENAISKYMYENYEEFEQIEFIGTNYEWTEDT